MSSIIGSARRLLTSMLRPEAFPTASPSSSSSSASSAAAAAAAARPLRSFSTTPAPQTKTIKPHRLPSDLIPPYPYGERRIYKQSNRGLYGAARIRFGNNVAPKHSNKSRRFWRPNVHVKVFPLPSLGARVKTRLTLRVLKTIRRDGGLEAYLLKDKPARVKELGPGGWNLRWLLMQSAPVQERLEAQRRTLGLPPAEARGRDDVVQYALDYATPGPLSVRSKKTIEELRAEILGGLGEFTLGNEDLSEVEGVKELSDEEEELLLRRTDAEDGEAKSTESQKEGNTVPS
ncbi:54S ribosomal protein L24 [Escovopsis weberi]|uniref:54S ribosomal protein L24 n=1 Tax=Escovopsis weberi TaxID=150374 RepID=A0A0N0RU71_ESCWE|nr:54S ribosomal protein L24 [Escovopsis weberi]